MPINNLSMYFGTPQCYHPIKRLRSDYGSELQSHKTNKWMQKEKMTFEPFTPYLQKQNGVSEQTGKTIMEMIRVTILEENINDNLCPKRIFIIIYIKNNWPTRALKNLSPYKACFTFEYLA